MVEMRCSAVADKKRNQPQDSGWPKGAKGESAASRGLSA